MFRRSLTSLFSTFLFEAPGGAAAGAAAAASAAATAEPSAAAAAAEAAAAAAAASAPPPAAAAAGAAAGTAAAAAATEQTVPYDRFKAVNDELQAIKARETERERQQMPELERARAEAEDARQAREAAERERDEIRKQAERTERQGWIREAARGAKFHNPEDAVLRIDPDGVATADAAKRAVEQLAANDTLKYLINTEGDSPTTGDLLTRVLTEGKPVEAGKDGTGDKPVIPADQFNALTADQLVALQETDNDLYERSLRAAAETPAQ